MALIKLVIGMIKQGLKQKLAQGIVAILLTVGFSIFSVFAASLKETAPERYVVKKGDTLWDISGFYLNEPWRWPELWVKNTQIDNPHLIYPGDVILLSFVDGEPVLSIEKQKPRLVLSPNIKQTDKRDAIGILPWKLLEPYIGRSWIVPREEYESAPKVLGNNEGSVTFANNDVLLTEQFDRSSDQFYIARNRGIITDVQGNELGIQLNHVASAQLLVDDLDSEWLVRVQNNKQEVVRGDLLWHAADYDMDDLALKAVENTVVGQVVGGFQDHVIFGKFDVVILDLGKQTVSPGNVVGIYSQGPDILNDTEPRYLDDSRSVRKALEDNKTISQPALKLGEAVVFSVFDDASFAIITRSKKTIRRGFFVGHP